MVVAPTVDTEEAAPAPHGSVRSIGALREELRQRKETGDWEVAEAQLLAEELRGLLTSVDQAVEQKKEGHAAAVVVKVEAVAPSSGLLRRRSGGDVAVLGGARL